MAEYILTKKSNLVAVADSVRGRTGETDKITLGEMIDDINYVIGGADTSDATAQASEILSGETAYISGGKVTGTMPNNGAISSTMDGINTKSIAIPAGYTSGGAVSLDNTIDNEVDAQTDLIEQIKNTVNELPDASSIKPTLQTKSVTPSTSQQTVAPDFGYDGLENVTVDAIPSEYIITNDATAIAADILNSKTAYVDGNKVTGTMVNNGAISTSMDGINVKSVTIPQGYTSGGTVSLDNTIDNEVDTQTDLIAQITTALEGKMAGSSEPVLQDKTIMPSVNEQIVAADNGYDGLNEVTVIGDANLVAENIKSGVSIFGVNGALSAESGNFEVIEGTITPTSQTQTLRLPWYKDTLPLFWMCIRPDLDTYVTPDNPATGATNGGVIVFPFGYIRASSSSTVPYLSLKLTATTGYTGYTGGHANISEDLLTDDGLIVYMNSSAYKWQPNIAYKYYIVSKVVA